MDSPISRLEEELWESCVYRRVADDMETVERWQQDPLAFQLEGLTIKPMPAALEPLLEQAIASWKQTEAKICARLRISREQFLEEFEKARSGFQSGLGEWSEFARHGEIVYGAVLNMDVVNMFAWILPAADPGRQDELHQIGRMVVAVFYTELLYKAVPDNFDGSRADPGSIIFRKMEARWSLVNSKAGIHAADEVPYGY